MIGPEVGTLLVTTRSHHGHDRAERAGPVVGHGAVMRALTNLMGAVVTGDVIADAVVAYHRALVARKRTTLVQLPVLADHDRVRRASLAIGWLTDLVSTPEPNRGREIEDAVTAGRLRSLAIQVRAEIEPRSPKGQIRGRSENP